MSSKLNFLFSLLVSTALFTKCKAQAGGMIAIPSTSVIDDNLQEDSNILSNQQMDSLYEVVKNISHSKGSIIKSKEGDYQYRRSFTAKVESEVNTLQLRNTISALKKGVSFDESNKHLFLENLHFLENLVHQYDIGKKFVDIGGFSFIFSLITNKDDDVSSAAFIVLAAAMQSNNDVQDYALASDLLKVINETLQLQTSHRLNGALLSLSALIRNHHKSLKTFILNKGIYTLSSVIDHPLKITKTYLRVVNLVNDITVELLGPHQSEILNPIKRIFIEDVKKSLFCGKIVELFSVAEEYIAQEKIFIALKNIYDVCESTFINMQLNKILDTKMKEYDPQKIINLWYPPLIDLELRYEMYQEMTKLSKRLSRKRMKAENYTQNKKEL